MTHHIPLTNIRTVALALALVAGIAVSCVPPGPQPPKTGIEPAGSETVDGWRYDFYVNHDAPCSESGAQTFLVATDVDSVSTDAAPLWTFLHGGGAGYYSENGAPMPNDRNKRQEDAQGLFGKLDGGLVGRAKNSPEAFRFLAVSMCSHDTYAGNYTLDPGNDTIYQGQQGVPTTGLAATVAAINWVKANYTTTEVVLHGGSAGSVGTFHVGYWMQENGQAPAAMVADSAVINTLWQNEQNNIGPVLPDNSENRCYRSPEAMERIPGRWDPLFQTEDDQAHLRISSGQLTVPVMHVWSTNDFNQCGSRSMDCPLPGGAFEVMGSAECNNQPIRDAIVAQNDERFVDFEVCVDRPGQNYSENCDWHVPTQTDGVPNTYANPGEPERDYNGVILGWVEARVAAAA